MQAATKILKQSLDNLSSELVRAKNESLDFYSRYEAAESRVAKVESQVQELQTAIDKLENKDGSKNKKTK